VRAGTAIALGDGRPGEAVAAGSAATVTPLDGLAETVGPPLPLQPVSTLPAAITASAATATGKENRKKLPIRHRHLKDTFPPGGLRR
jgi:hypothetical protein